MTFGIQWCIICHGLTCASKCVSEKMLLLSQSTLLKGYDANERQKRKIVLLKSINENMNSVVVNQEMIYLRLEAIIKKMDKLEKDHNVIIETTSIEK